MTETLSAAETVRRSEVTYGPPGYIHAYLALCRMATDITRVHGGRVRLFWNGPALDAEGWRREFIAALNRRINRHGASGRNHSRLKLGAEA